LTSRCCICYSVIYMNEIEQIQTLINGEQKKSDMAVLLRDEPNFTAVLKVGGLIEGAIIEKTSKAVHIDLGLLGTGIIYGRELMDAYEILKKSKPGDKILGKIVELENEDGYVELSLKEASRQRVWDQLREKQKSQEIIVVKISEANRGGLVAPISGIKAFLPVSQLAPKHYPRIEGGDKEKILVELNKLVGQELKVKILDMFPEEEKLIISEKEVKNGEMTEVLKHFKVGDIVEGEVAGVVDFGAFVKLPAPFQNNDGSSAPESLEGLIHISELDYKLIENPQEVIKVGDKVRAQIIDLEGDRISLSLKRLKEDPWKNIGSIYKKGDIVAGEVTKFNPFGAFVQLDQNIHGLVHISEFGSENKMKTALILGQKYNFKIISVEPEEHRMALGLADVSDGQSEQKKEE